MLSEPRFQPYLRATGNQTAEAFNLYRWNMALSAASYEALHLVEVGLRNAMDAQLRKWNAVHVDRYGQTHGEDWLLDPHHSLKQLLGKDLPTSLERARKAVNRAGRPAPSLCHDDVVAQLTLGTWRFLLPAKNLRKSPSKADLWNNGLKDAFPHLARSHSDLVDDLDKIHRFRNRVAHLEPIFGTGHANSAYAAMCRVTSDLDPGMRSWLDKQSRVDEVLRRAPHVSPAAP
ncbi:hypothetical protein [Cellulosimicrobium sp. TH-20]|uniref:hypothetical protein n=1 Tax=Cellulosimicrobium sp. TH-20 TaxID=1980001 RepID=UPI0011A1579F|nr:hypothetical protein [Cellulosimicrobium sp. TH-20]